MVKQPSISARTVAVRRLNPRTLALGFGGTDVGSFVYAPLSGFVGGAIAGDVAAFAHNASIVPKA